MIEPLPIFMPRKAMFLAAAGMRTVMALCAGSLKSAISLAPLRSRPAPSSLAVTSITIGRFSRTLPPVQLSRSPLANLARRAASKSAGSAAACAGLGAAAAERDSAAATSDAPPTNQRLVALIGLPLKAAGQRWTPRAFSGCDYFMDSRTLGAPSPHQPAAANRPETAQPISSCGSVARVKRASKALGRDRTLQKQRKHQIDSG